MLRYKNIKKSGTYECIKTHELIRVILCSARAFIQTQGAYSDVINKRLCTVTDNFVKPAKRKKHDKKLYEALMECFTESIYGIYFYDGLPITELERKLYTDLCELISDSASRGLIVSFCDFDDLFNYYKYNLINVDKH